MVDTGLYVSYGLFLATAIAAFVLPLINSLRSPKDLGKSAVGIGALVVLFVISYAFAGSEVTAKYITQGVNEGSSKMIGAGLTMFYISFILALVGIVFSEINKALK